MMNPVRILVIQAVPRAGLNQTTGRHDNSANLSENVQTKVELSRDMQRYMQIHILS